VRGLKRAWKRFECAVLLGGHFPWVPVFDHDDHFVGSVCGYCGATSQSDRQRARYGRLRIDQVRL
jgi:hypothetical protein